MTTALTTPVLPTYARQDVTFVSGDGSWLVADTGERYLDLGIGTGAASYLTSDLSYDYVRINADYRT